MVHSQTVRVSERMDVKPLILYVSHFQCIEKSFGVVNVLLCISIRISYLCIKYLLKERQKGDAWRKSGV